MTHGQQWNFDRDDPESWRNAIDRAARSMVYVLSNRILFYQAVRLRNDLPLLRLPSRAKKDPQKALEYLRDRFDEAVEKTGDYEPVFFPHTDEWAALMCLSGVNSLDAWDKTISAVERFEFKELPTDILGHVFQRLISPEERHKFGQYYTEESIVDVINAFCIRNGEATVLDPACGSGSFLVRSWYRKNRLDTRQTNQELLEGIYGCDINPFPAHLATLNLAARNISNEENYPRISRQNFFKVGPGDTFCELPKASGVYEGRQAREKIILPELDVIIGNPPYVRHEQIPKAIDLPKSLRDQSKEYVSEVAEQSFPGIDLSRQSDLHVYFWPVAARFLRENGWLGFLTSSSWLDARYGFALQRWILTHFRLVAVIESIHEPWFEDARVKTAATILQRSDDAAKRDKNLVRFVRLKRPLVEILGNREDEEQRQEAAEDLRDLILKRKTDHSTDQLRIMVKRQSDLWADGLSVAQMFARQKAFTQDEVQTSEAEELVGTRRARRVEQKTMQSAGMQAVDYGGGKWGRYLRAPDFYFEIMREFGTSFTRIGDIATIKFGIKSGCDAFFMPRDVSADLLAENQSEMEWLHLPLMRHCKRAEVESGEVIVVQCGDKTLHPIESRYVRPEIHSPMQIETAIVTAAETNRVVLWVNQALEELKGTYAHEFITWGSKQTFASKKSKSVPIPQRPTCASRQLWYDLTGLKPGIGFWPMTQKYRHIIAWNPSMLPGNHRLFDIHPSDLTADEAGVLMAILNSTLVGLFKHFYGRYAGSEGTLDTEIVDVLMIEIPSPLRTPKDLRSRFTTALEAISQREVTHLVEQEFLDCHTEEDLRELQRTSLGLPLELQREDRRELDLLVFELLGVASPKRREQLVDQLYRETSLYYRAQRTQDIQSTINRSQGEGRGRVSVLNLALSAWEEIDSDLQTPLGIWLKEHVDGAKIVSLPDGEVRLPEATNFFDATTVYFGRNPAISHVCANRIEADLIAAIARTGLRGPVSIPRGENDSQRLLEMFQARMAEASTRFEEVAQQYAGSDRLREQLTDVLRRWFVHGKPHEGHIQN